MTAIIMPALISYGQNNEFISIRFVTASVIMRQIYRTYQMRKHVQTNSGQWHTMIELTFKISFFTRMLSTVISLGTILCGIIYTVRLSDACIFILVVERIVLSNFSGPVGGTRGLVVSYCVWHWMSCSRCRMPALDGFYIMNRLSVALCVAALRHGPLFKKPRMVSCNLVWWLWRALDWEGLPTADFVGDGLAAIWKELYLARLRNLFSTLVCACENVVLVHIVWERRGMINIPCSCRKQYNLLSRLGVQFFR